MSVSARHISHCGLNRESCLSELDVSSGSYSRNKLKCMVRILSVSARWIFHSGLNRESSLCVLYEY